MALIAALLGPAMTDVLAPNVEKGGVSIPACASSHLSRELRALGHAVRLMSPVYVMLYVKRQKNGAAGAEAITAAVCVSPITHWLQMA